MTVSTINEAWVKADEIFPTDYIIDDIASDRAGYSIYRSTVFENAYICDLGDRLEVNLSDGTTINIWVVEEVAKDDGLITCQEYNRIWAKKCNGFVIRYAFGKWIVCDGFAPNTISKCHRTSIFIGYVIKSCNTVEEAEVLRDNLNKYQGGLKKWI